MEMVEIDGIEKDINQIEWLKVIALLTCYTKSINE